MQTGICTSCQGNGWVKVDDPYNHPTTDAAGFMASCPVCKGMGWVSVIKDFQEYIEGGEQWQGTMQIFQL